MMKSILLTFHLYQQGLASIYGYPGDRYETFWQDPACKSKIQSTLGKETWAEYFKNGIAHRTLPCGTKVLICNKTHTKCIDAYVVDRGPYGAIDKNGKWHVRKKLQENERYRGIADLRPEIATMLNFSGLETVFIYKSNLHFMNIIKLCNNKKNKLLSKQNKLCLNEITKSS